MRTFAIEPSTMTFIRRPTCCVEVVEVELSLLVVTIHPSNTFSH